jgi:hypothetical protein
MQPPQAPIYSTAPPPRPPAVTAFAILNIVFASMGILCTPFALVQMFMPQPGPTGALYTLMKEGPYGIWSIVSTALGILVAFVLLASGIGMLKLAPWGRFLGIGYCVYALLATGITLALYLGLVFPKIMQLANSASDPEKAAYLGGAYGGLGGGLCGCGYPLVLLVFLLLPATKAAFSRP